MQAKNFDQATFEKMLGESLIRLASSEKITKETLKTLSRDVLEAVHITGDIGYANRLIEVLTPINKKVTILFYKHFAGFSFDDVLGIFTKKSKKRYDEAVKLSTEFLADPNNNIWSWAQRHIEVEQKPYSVETIETTVKTMLTRAQNAGLDQKDVFRAMLKGGLQIETILDMMDELGYAEVKDAAPAA